MRLIRPTNSCIYFIFSCVFPRPRKLVRQAMEANYMLHGIWIVYYCRKFDDALSSLCLSSPTRKRSRAWCWRNGRKILKNENFSLSTILGRWQISSEAKRFGRISVCCQAKNIKIGVLFSFQNISEIGFKKTRSLPTKSPLETPARERPTDGASGGPSPHRRKVVDRILNWLFPWLIGIYSWYMIPRDGRLLSHTQNTINVFFEFTVAYPPTRNIHRDCATSFLSLFNTIMLVEVMVEGCRRRCRFGTAFQSRTRVTPKKRILCVCYFVTRAPLGAQKVRRGQARTAWA